MLPSFCLVCDAEPGKCDHAAGHYLNPIGFEQVVDELGKHVGWNVPPEERERWQSPPPHAKPSKRSAGREPKPAQRLIVDLEGWMFVDRQLEQTVRAAHELEPLRVTMLVEHVVQLAEAGKLDNPAGLLSVKLKEMNGNHTKEEQ